MKKKTDNKTEKKTCRVCGEIFDSITDKIVDGRKICPFCGGFMDGWTEEDKKAENFYWEATPSVAIENGRYKATFNFDEVEIQNGGSVLRYTYYDTKEEKRKTKEIEKTDIKHVSIQPCSFFRTGQIVITYEQQGETKEWRQFIFDLKTYKKALELEKIFLDNGIVVRSIKK